MSTVPLDTSNEAQHILWKTLRAIPPARRVALAFQLSDELHEATRQGIRHRHPDYDERQVELAFRRLVWGEEIFRRIYPDCEIRP